MSALVASNALLLNRATSLRTLLNSGHFLKLFRNNFLPTPADSLGSFVEADFGGYASVDLTGQFGAPLKVVDGEYQIATPAYTFSCTGAPNNSVYGAYVTDGFDVKYSFVFAAPIIVSNGTIFTVQISPQEWALSILP